MWFSLYLSCLAFSGLPRLVGRLFLIKSVVDLFSIPETPNYLYVRTLDIISQSVLFVVFLSLCFSLNIFYCPALKFTDCGGQILKCLPMTLPPVLYTLV